MALKNEKIEKCAVKDYLWCGYYLFYRHPAINYFLFLKALRGHCTSLLELQIFPSAKRFMCLQLFILASV